ncbi:MAG: aromatic amino acid hydroxylase [Bacteroidetes bacterium]|jgi:phenylalanine-4-hydroxylase|nr:MAG: phenylalanine 4-monooxygenase [Cryomorphaceae bacterium BACL29 MAG-121220-bin8]MDA0757413.1 aromatic amino acid hydroxylase [Bacteroidota bacterium]MDA1019845.1 aromatic amino acid hydroxylase [Bacteroidota bacterium]|tara:strand:+ start:11214 stop:12959 length:1746 start_codon:yes stop_codon:yes gene_type:complete
MILKISNPIIDQLPDHLKQYIKPQNYESYTAINQSVWKYVMRSNISFLKKHAHDFYITGLEKACISADKIPSMYGMNRILKDIGWAAVAVDGFIPPSAFMEFQSYNVLIIASEIRQLQNIEYTPAPDIIHESAGHAPFLAHPEYSEYLRRFGQIGSKAISSSHDWEMFIAIRDLSILKETVGSTKQEIDISLEKVLQLQNTNKEFSEMELIRNIHWWTVEYGLIGNLEDFKIYGAGLLSSIGESKWCLDKKVVKKPYSLEAAYQRFDITKPQPQLFVIPNFSHLSKVLEELADQMSLRKGGIEGLKKLINSKQLGTIELSTGLQISGVFNDCISNPNNNKKAAYLATNSKTALSYRNKELIGHSIKYHSSGFGSPIGKLKKSNLAIEDMSPSDLELFGIIEGKKTSLKFESGVIVKGTIITGIRNVFGKILLISFKDCLVTFENQILFQPDWGVYDMAVGNKITSAYSGCADNSSFKIEKSNYKSTPTSKVPKSNKLYKDVEKFSSSKFSSKEKEILFKKIINTTADDWLVILNFYEVCLNNSFIDYSEKALLYLNKIMKNFPKYYDLINNGIALIKTNKS